MAVRHCIWTSRYVPYSVVRVASGPVSMDRTVEQAVAVRVTDDWMQILFLPIMLGMLLGVVGEIL